MSIRLLILLTCTCCLALPLTAVEADGPVEEAPPIESVGEAMDVLKRSLRKIKRAVGKGALTPELGGLAADAVKAARISATIRPKGMEEGSDAHKDYSKRMEEVAVAFADLGKALAAKDLEEAGRLVAKLGEQKNEGHELYE